MVRVLHLHRADADLQTRQSVRALMDRSVHVSPTMHVARSIGPGADYPHLLWAVLGLRRDGAREFDLVHAWDQTALAAAVIAGASRIVFTVPAGSRLPEWLRRAAVRREARFVCTSPAEHAALAASAGVPPAQCHLIRPPLPAPAAPVLDRATARARLGVADDDFVMLAPGESTRAADHERAVWAGSILHVVDERYRVLLWGRGPRLGIAAGLGDKLRQPRLVVTAGPDARYEDLLPAADALLVTARAPVPTLPVAMAMSAGVPVVSVPRPELADVLADGVTALLVPSPAPRLIAQRVLDLRADSGARSGIVSRARDRAQDLFSVDRFLEQSAQLYAEVSASQRTRLTRAAESVGLSAGNHAGA